MFTASFLDPAWVWLRRGALDTRIAHGADLAETRQLARRARQLNSRRCRRSLAHGLRSLVDAAEDTDRGFSSAVPVERKQIMDETGFILQIAIDLESDEDLGPRGIALIERLLTHGDSPAYAPSPPGSLRNALVHAHAALHLS